MTEAADPPRAHLRSTPHGTEELLGRLARALDDGRVSTADVEGLLSRGRADGPERPNAAGVLYALGAVVVFCGLAIAYGTVFAHLPWGARVTTPYLFPLAAFAACVEFVRRDSPRWQRELAGLVGYVALGIAFGVSGSASGWLDSGRDDAAWAAGAALVSVVVVAVVWRVTRSDRLLWLGMPAALAVVGIATAYLIGLWDTDDGGNPANLGWVILAGAGIAAAIAAILVGRDRSGCRYATLWATLGGYAAVMLSGDDLGRFSAWHVVLAGVVVAAFLTAAALDFDPLIWIAAAGGAVWVVMIATVVGSATGAGLAVVMAGIGLAGLGALVARLRRTPKESERRPTSGIA